MTTHIQDLTFEDITDSPPPENDHGRAYPDNLPAMTNDYDHVQSIEYVHPDGKLVAFHL